MIRKRIIRVFAILLCCSILSGCWDYRGLDELTIVAGVAVDRSKKDPSMLTVSMEIIDSATSADKSALHSTLIEVEGRTVFDAIHNANQMMYDRLYFGSAQVILVSSELASEEGLHEILQAFLRDNSTRDNISVLISRDKTAKEIITPSQTSNDIIAFIIDKSISGTWRTANSTRAMPLYKIYNDLASGTSALILPAIYTEMLGDFPQPVLDGVGIFNGDKLVGYLRNSTMPCYMLSTEKLSGGTYTYLAEIDGVLLPVTLEIFRSKPKANFSYDQGDLTLELRVEVIASAIDISTEIRPIDMAMIELLEQRAEQALVAEIRDMIEQVQAGTGADIFGFGKTIYQKNPDVWEELKDDWENVFRSAKLDIQCQFTIKDIGQINSYSPAPAPA